MKKTIKYLRFQNFKLELQQAHPKQISRAIIYLKDEQGNSYKTSHYGQVVGQIIKFQDVIDILYTNQQMFKFQTICEHEYGYQRQQLQAMFTGQVYIKTENFFRPMFIHVFDKNGRKCGILRYISKIVQKQQGKVQPKAVVESPKQETTVKVDLIGKLAFYSAFLTITNPSYQKQKFKTNLTINIEVCGQTVTSICNGNLQWNFDGRKIQYTEQSADEMLFLIKINDQIIMAGETTVSSIVQNKRFSTHEVQLYNLNKLRVGILKLDIRYLTKLQILDLLYSPTKLAKHRQKLNQRQKTEHDATQASRIKQMRYHRKEFNYSANDSQPLRTNSSLSLSYKNNLKRRTPQNHNYSIQPEAYEKTKSTSLDKHNKFNSSVSYDSIQEKRVIQQKINNKNLIKKYLSNQQMNYGDPIKIQNISPLKNRYYHKRAVKSYKNDLQSDQFKLPNIWERK